MPEIGESLGEAVAVGDVGVLLHTGTAARRDFCPLTSEPAFFLNVHPYPPRMPPPVSVVRVVPLGCREM